MSENFQKLEKRIAVLETAVMKIFQTVEKTQDHLIVQNNSQIKINEHLLKHKEREDG